MRKTAPKEEAAASADSAAEETSTEQLAKRSRPESEPEYFPKRDLEDLWKQVFLAGTEWYQLDLVHQHKWSFSNLENAFEEGGKLHGKNVYLFGCTEPQVLFFQGQAKVTWIPAVVAVVSTIPPSDKIGINSGPSKAVKILPLKEMKMDWAPYISMGNMDSQVERLKSQIFILRCWQRRADSRLLNIESKEEFENRLPCFDNPLKKGKVEQSTFTEIMCSMGQKHGVYEFDWKHDELEEFIDEVVEKEELSGDQKDAFKKFVKEKVREAKKADREAGEARKKDLEEMSEERKTALQNMKYYKFYPVATSDSPDVSNFKSLFINRYHGRAHQVL